MVWHQYQHKLGMILVLVGLCFMIPTCSQAGDPAVEAPVPGTGRQDRIEVEVYSLFLDPASQQPVVTLVDHEKKKAFPIWIGLSEAQAIQSELEGTEHFRPLTHDLLADILLKTNGKVHHPYQGQCVLCDAGH